MLRREEIQSLIIVPQWSSPNPFLSQSSLPFSYHCQKAFDVLMFHSPVLSVKTIASSIAFLAVAAFI
eukprot:m.104708 g.104708  ORF g.104708 m.104708 type:complete len:67 (-) comp9116_c0_seq2:238-438(-)